MIDLHCHILPKLDDGAIDLADSVEMARQADADGIALICATPHIHPSHQVHPPQIEGRVAAVNAELERQGVEARVTRGGEVAEEMLPRLDDDTLERVSLGGGRWLLVEPKPGPLSVTLLAVVERLEARGFFSVIAHPERHPGPDFREQLVALVHRGALIQATAALVAEGPASEYLLELAADGLIHLLGSDAHSSHAGRPLRLSEGLTRLAEVERVRPYLGWIASDGPAAILSGEHPWPPWVQVR